MPELTGPERQEYLDVLAEWRFTNIVLWEKDAREKLEQHLPAHTQRSINEILYQYAVAGGKISRVEEKNEYYRRTWKYHYDLWPTIDGRVLYVETRFDQRKPDWPKIVIVNIHPPETSQWAPPP